MRNILMLLVLYFLIGSCQRHNSTDKKQNETIRFIHDTTPKIALTPDVETRNEHITIQGIWAENEDENAWYWIKKDSIYFVEHPDNPVPYKYVDDTLHMIFEGYTSSDKVILLTLDSLWLEGETNTDTIKLYKRR